MPEKMRNARHDRLKAIKKYVDAGWAEIPRMDELTDEQWALVEPLLPPSRSGPAGEEFPHRSSTASFSISATPSPGPTSRPTTRTTPSSTATTGNGQKTVCSSRSSLPSLATWPNAAG